MQGSCLNMELWIYTKKEKKQKPKRVADNLFISVSTWNCFLKVLGDPIPILPCDSQVSYLPLWIWVCSSETKTKTTTTKWNKQASGWIWLCKLLFFFPFPNFCYWTWFHIMVAFLRFSFPLSDQSNWVKSRRKKSLHEETHPAFSMADHLSSHLLWKDKSVINLSIY